MTRWHQITGTALTASTKLVGNSHKGGSWQLDYQLGDVVEELALTPLIQESYRGTFDPIISFSAPTRVIIEAELTILTFRFSLSEPPPSSGVEVAVTGNVAQSLTQLDLLDVSQTGGDPPVGDFDFSGFFFNITSGTASVRVPAFQDGNQEQPYDVTYTLQSGEGYTVDPSARSVTITFADTRDDLNTDPDPPIDPDPPTGPTDPTDPTDPTPPVATQFVQLIGSPELLVETEQTNAILTIVIPEDIPEEGLTVFIKADRCNGLAEFNLEQLTVTGGNSLVFNEDGSGFAVTVTEPTATISIPVLNDGVPEGLETVRFTLESGEDYTPDPNADEATFSLVDSSILPLDFNTQANTVQFVGSPLQTINAKFSLIGGDLNRAIEVGIFEVDDDTGGIDIDGDGIIDVKPEDADYQSTALSRARPLFAQLPGNVFPNPSQTLSGFSGNQRIGFYAVLNNSTEGILSRITLDSQNAPKSEVVFATPSANNGLNPVGNVSGNGSSQLGLSFDLSDENGENFNDLGLAIEVTEEESALNPSLDDGELGETLDLRNIDVNGDDIVDDNIVVQFTVNADGVYDNFVGLYEADDERGAVAGIAPGADGYAAEAIRRRVIGFQGSGSGSVTLSGNDRKILVPFMIADGTPESFLADNVNNDPTLGPIAYFEDRFANPDGVDHIIGIDSNTLGFEEFYNGGDHDFNDAVAMINYLT